MVRRIRSIVRGEFAGLNRVVKINLIEAVRFEQRLERGKRVRQTGVWKKKSFLDRRNSFSKKNPKKANKTTKVNQCSTKPKEQHEGQWGWKRVEKEKRAIGENVEALRVSGSTSCRVCRPL